MVPNGTSFFPLSDRVGAEKVIRTRGPGLSCWGPDAEDGVWRSRSPTLPSSASSSCCVSHAVVNKTWSSRS